jgi:outer membrane lipoprotein-sorting protein
MNRRLVRGLGLLAAVLFLTGCFTDAATRLAYDIESGVNRMNRLNQARYSIRHTPAESSECTGPYTVQLDKVGALIVWCKDTAGNVVANGSTSYHARFIDTPTTFILDKPAGSTLAIDLERRAGRVVVTDVH